MENIRIILSNKCYNNFAPIFNHVDVMIYKKVKIKLLNAIQNVNLKTIIVDNVKYAKYEKYKI